MAKLINTVYVIDPSQMNTQVKPDKNDILISNDLEWDKFKSIEQRFKNLIIVADLGENWPDPINGIYYGYELAYEFFTTMQETHAFNFLFVHFTSRERLLEESSKYYILAKRFPHKQISPSEELTELKLPNLSKRKFDYLINYSLQDEGILNDIQHNLNDSSKLSGTLNTIERYESLVTQEILDTVQEIRNSDNIEDITSLKEQLKAKISVLKSTLFGKERSAKASMLDYTIMVVEDNEEANKKIVDAFKRYFKNVVGFTSGTEALNELKNEGIVYHAVITDMELLKGEFDEEIQGIDILEYCETKAPYITTRIITASPKDALKRLTGKEVEHIIFKDLTSESLIPPYEDLPKFVTRMTDEIKKRQEILEIKGPELSWWETLTRELYLLEIFEPEAYQEIWKKAISDAEAFIEGEFDDNSQEDKLSVKFVAVKHTTKGGDHKLGLGIIERLLAHRLITLWFAKKHNWGEFFFRGEYSNVYTNLLGFQQPFDRNSRHYFNSFLGFHALGTTLKSMKDEPELKCQIIPNNLFPKENEWLISKLGNDLEIITLVEASWEFQEEFVEFMQIFDGTTVTDHTSVDDAITMLEKVLSERNKILSDDEKKRELNRPMKRMMEYSNKFPESIKPLNDIVEQVKGEIFS